MHKPTIPVMMIITAAKTVSRTMVGVGVSVLNIKEMISATSMMVTATARTSVP